MSEPVIPSQTGLFDTLRRHLASVRWLRGATRLPIDDLPGRRFPSGLQAAELSSFGPAAVGGAMLGLLVLRAICAGRAMGAAETALLVVGVLIAGMLAGMQIAWLLSRRLRPCLILDEDVLLLARDGEVVARLPRAGLELFRFGELREGGRALLGVTLLARGQRPIHLYANARRADLVGLPVGTAGGMWLERPVFDALLAALGASTKR